ncbi:MAG: 50S ribosomal protein L4 [Candidatus Aenigmatarchaeota archaeon]
MKTQIYDMSGKSVGEIELPSVFKTSYRPDLIKRAVHAIQSLRRQPYGTNILAGRRTSAHYHGSRHYRFTMMNKEMARIRRIHGKSATGTYLAFRARFVAQATKGIRAHAPKAEKIWTQDINKKELLLSLKSAIAATANTELLKKRGHVFTELVVIDDAVEKIAKTKDLVGLLEKIGLEKEIERCKKSKVRAGRGKTRGRKYKRKKGIIVVMSKDAAALKSARNIAGADVVSVEHLLENHNTELFAPGAQAGRLAIFSKASLNKLKDL